MKDGATTLRQRLEDAGYFSAYSQLGDGNFRAYDWEKMASTLPEATQALWRFFLLGTGLPAARLRTLIGEAAFEFLREHKLCGTKGRNVSLGALALIAHRELVFFAEQGRDPAGYFGEDTKALMTLLPRLETGQCLCLYPGSGAAALPLLYRTGVNCAFARGPYNPNLIAANLRLAGAKGGCEFLGERIPRRNASYDLILAAAPSLVEPPGFKLSRVIAGGRDGLREVREVLAIAKERLAPAGQLLMSFILFAQSESAKMRERLEAFLKPAGLGGSITICSKHLMEIGVPIHNLILSAAASTPGAAPEAAARMHRHLKRLKYEAAYLVKARFYGSARPARREVMDFSDLYYGGWTF